MFPDRRIRAPGLRQPFRGIGLRFPPAPSLRLPAASPICFFPSHKTDFAGRFTARQESRDRSEGRRPYEKSGRSVPRVDVHSQSAAALFAHFDLVAGAQRVVAVAKRPFRARYETSVTPSPTCRKTAPPSEPASIPSLSIRSLASFAPRTDAGRGSRGSGLPLSGGHRYRAAVDTQRTGAKDTPSDESPDVDYAVAPDPNRGIATRQPFYDPSRRKAAACRASGRPKIILVFPRTVAADPYILLSLPS